MTNINVALDFFKRKGNSKTQEQFAEYFFLKDIILQAALNEEKLDVARSDFDAFGFDLFISRQRKNEKKTLNIQLKATSGKCRVWDIHKSLLEMETGRIILVLLNTGKLNTNNTNEITPKYLMFDKTYTNAALSTKPKVVKETKCQVKFNQFKEISENLLEIFNV